MADRMRKITINSAARTFILAHDRQPSVPPPIQAGPDSWEVEVSEEVFQYLQETAEKSDLSISDVILSLRRHA